MKPFLFTLMLLSALMAQAQYRFDNVKYSTVYPEDVCNIIKSTTGFLILDVRSPGEFADTSSAKSLNIGHFANAVNIDIRELPSRWSEIASYKNSPVLVYCSHSQRSRRAAKMLADSGFSKVYNINGGLTNFHLHNLATACPQLMVQSNLPYKILSPLQAAQALAEGTYYIIDVRPDSAFNEISPDAAQNALGRFSGSVNIPAAALTQNLASVPKNKPVLLVDDYGNESARAAELLTANGFHNVSILFNGLNGWVTELPGKKRTGWTTSAAFHMINALAFDALMKSTNAVVIDIRSAEEFSNNAQDVWRNAGHIKNARNIPYNQLIQKTTPLQTTKDAPIVIYGFSGQPEVFKAAHWLTQQGYPNVSVLLGGLFNLRWRAANLKGQQHLADWVVNVPAENQ